MSVGELHGDSAFGDVCELNVCGRLRDITVVVRECHRRID